METKVVDITPKSKPVRKFVIELTEDEAADLMGVCAKTVSGVTTTCRLWEFFGKNQVVATEMVIKTAGLMPAIWF